MLIRCTILASLLLQTDALSLGSSTSFLGGKVSHRIVIDNGSLSMRKQKASDKRTRRMQRNQGVETITETLPMPGTSPLTPMAKGEWRQKTISIKNQFQANARTGGRGRSRKRSIVYSNLASYHNQFLELLTQEFLAEVREIFMRSNDSSANQNFSNHFLDSS